MARGGGTRGVAHSAESQAELGPLLRHEVTHPGISTPPPTSSSRCHLLSPRCPAWRQAGFGRWGCSCCSRDPSLPSPVPRESEGGAPWRDPPEPLTPTRRREGPARVPVSGRGGAAPARVWIPRIPRPDKEAESAAGAGRGGSCRGLYGDAPGRARLGLPRELGISGRFAFVWAWTALKRLPPRGLRGWIVRSFVYLSVLSTRFLSTLFASGILGRVESELGH